MELSLSFRSLRVSHTCIPSAIPSFHSPRQRVAHVKFSSCHQTEALCQSGISSYRNLAVKAGESVSTSFEDEDQSAVASSGDSGRGTAPERDEECPENLHKEIQTKADRILKDAVDNFVQSDIEEASKKYDMEEELFAEIDFAQVNAFTERPFAGNPAAVCYLPLRRSNEWLQLVAREFNLSETAFLIKRNTRRKRSTVFKKSTEQQLAEEETAFVDEFDLRWFTPKVEVDLCGHATLASAHLLFSSGIAVGDSIIFHTRSGVLKAKKVSGYDKAKIATKDANFEDRDMDDDSQAPKPDYSENLKPEKKRPIGVGVVELDFPFDACTKCDDAEAEVLSAALGGVKLSWAGKTAGGNYLVEVSSSKEIKQLQPELIRMLNLPGLGVIVTASANEESGLDFVSRFFAPKAGIIEDPVTGSAHCSLGPFWAEKLGKASLKAYQASERGGYIDIRVNKNEGRVYLQGSAVIVMAGVLLNTMRA